MEIGKLIEEISHKKTRALQKAGDRERLDYLQFQVTARSIEAFTNNGFIQIYSGRYDYYINENLTILSRSQTGRVRLMEGQKTKVNLTLPEGKITIIRSREWQKALKNTEKK